MISSPDIPLRILIVDDDEVDRLVVRRALLNSEIPVILTEATTCDEAIVLLSTIPFDCTFVDFELPDHNGLFLVQAARSLAIQHPLIILTGQGDEQIAVDLMKAGATDYLTKSQISPAVLLQTLRNGMRINRAERDVLLANRQLQLKNELLLQQNQALEEQRVQIEIQNLQRADFIAHLTHDLRTPLVAANLMFKLFQQEAFCPISSEMHVAVLAMEHSNLNLLDLVNTLLEVHHYESGSKTLTLTTCRLWDIIVDVVEDMQPLARSKSITLVAHSSVSDPTVLQLRADFLEMRRMIANLVGNALKFTDAGTIELRLGFRPAQTSEPQAPQGWILLDITDTGLGMSAAEQQVIFHRFRKGNHQQVGSGLGLHLVHRIVSSHDGLISVTSAVGEGSLFQILLPACSTPD